VPLYVKNLDEIAAKLEHLADGELDKIIDWTFNSLSHSVLKKIRAVWPIKTKESWNRWQFKKVKDLEYIIINPATNPYDGRQYVPDVYAKGDRSKKPIVNDIVQRAIEETIEKEAEDNFTERLQRYLK
jgi:hypothetical protein